MGVIGSICCSQDGNQSKKKKSQGGIDSPRKPVLPVKPSPKPSIQIALQKMENEQIQKIQQQKTTQTVAISENPKKQQNIKHIDVSEVIENLYPAPKTYKWESFDIVGKLGKGGFGQVYLAELKENKEKGIVQRYAVKRVGKSDIAQKKLTANIKLEKKILQESKSQFITTLHYAFRDQVFLYFVMECAEGGDTYTLIDESSPRLNEFKKAGEEAVRFLLGCLILGMEYLHSKKYVYRDLKPENILMFRNGYAKLTDFGLAKELHENELAKTEAGTTIYYAPEMVMRKGYDRMVDIWAIGIYAYEMSNYSPPFSSADIRDRIKVKRVIKYGETKRNWRNPNISEELKDFINSILRYDPKQRLGYNGFEEMKNHKFFTSVDFNWKELEEMKMASPLKPIIDAKPTKLKPYVANEKRKMANVNATSSEELDGWTYVGPELR